jgi:hypothetical protein
MSAASRAKTAKSDPAEVNGHSSVSTSAADLAAAVALVRFVSGHRVSVRALREGGSLPRWRDLFRDVVATDASHRPAFLLQLLALLEGRGVADVAPIRKAIDQAERLVKVEPDDPEPDEPPPEQRPFAIRALGSADFAQRLYRREWLIRRIAVLGQPCIVGGPKKALKTSLMVDFIVSLGLALKFLAVFEVPDPFKVLFLSGESGDATIQETARRVCQAKGVRLEDLEGKVFWSFDLPQLSNPQHMEALAEFIREHGIQVVVIDPLYLCLLSGNSKLDAANLFDVGPLLKRIADVCLDAGATPILVHHLRKNREDPKSPPELEDLAFAGVQEFARQWILIGRREAYEPGTGDHKLWVNVGGSAGHSGTWAVDVDEGTIDEDFGGREWNVAVKGASEVRAEAKQTEQERKDQQKAERDKAIEEAKTRKFFDDVETAYGILAELGPSTKTKWKQSIVPSWNDSRFGPTLERLVARGRVRGVQVNAPYGRGMKLQSGYEVVPINPDGTPQIPIPDYPGLGRTEGDSPAEGSGRGYAGRKDELLPLVKGGVRPSGIETPTALTPPGEPRTAEPGPQRPSPGKENTDGRADQ